MVNGEQIIAAHLRDNLRRDVKAARQLIVAQSEHRGMTPGMGAAPVVVIPEDQQPAVQRGNQQIHQRRIQGVHQRFPVRRGRRDELHQQIGVQKEQKTEPGQQR